MSITRRLATIAKRLAVASTALVGANFPLAANAGTLTTLYRFQGTTDGSLPSGALLYQNGSLYGTASEAGASGLGTVFKVDANTGAFRLVYAFKGGSDGAYPGYGVISQGDLLYGTTENGGGGCSMNTGCGTIFAVNAESGDEEVLYPFPGVLGFGELSYLDGELYGAASYGGTGGSIFSFNLSTSTFATLYSFTGGTDGALPGSQLLYHGSVFYGDTYDGGGGNCHKRGNGCGVVFSFDPSSNAENVIHSFASIKGGRHGLSNLAYGDGSLIGDTSRGGSKSCLRGCGVSFAINVKNGHEKILSETAGYYAVSAVAGNIYETFTGAGGNGQLVQVNLKTGQQTILYTFSGGKDGSEPGAPLTYHDGAFYGTTVKGGDKRGCDNQGCGTVFKLVP